MSGAIASFARRNALLLAVCAAVTLPIWLVRYPPMQDFPVHQATIRILHDFSSPRFAFDQDYELTLGRTQYVGFYGAAHVLAFAFGPRGALLLLLAFFLAGTVLGLRSLLVALERDERLAFGVVPALYGALTAIGLMPFLVAVPVLLWGLALLVRQKLDPSWRKHALVAAVGLALFYLHVVHLGIFLLGALVLFPLRRTTRARVGAAAALVPSTVALLWWMVGTNVGRRVFEVTTHWGTKNRPPLGGAIADMHVWVADAYPDPSDEITFALLLAALGYAAFLAYRDADASRPLPVRGYWLVPLACFVLYLTGERSRGAIWPLGQRYMLPAAILALPLLAMPSAARARRRATAAILGAGALSVANAAVHFVAFEREVGDLPAAIAQMAERKRVAALVYRPHARSSRFWPMIHVGSYYQAEKGGVVMFTFAGYDQWPVDFRRGRYPLFDGPATPRWEFFPEEVALDHPLSGYFDYVLARERGDSPAPPGFRLKWRGDRWEVFERAD